MGDARRVKVAVIGSGFGGLAAAVRLQALGFGVTVYEARDKPGGRAYVYQDRRLHLRCRADRHHRAALPRRAVRRPRAGAWPITSSCCPVTPFYRLLWADGDEFDYDGDMACADRAARAPATSPDTGDSSTTRRRVFARGYEDLAATPFLRFSDMLRVAPQLARLRADRSVYATVTRFVRDDRLREALASIRCWSAGTRSRPARSTR